jgi:hypothetical protein
LHLAYRRFCRLDLDDKVPDHSTFSVNRHGRFRDSDLFRQVFEAVVRACMDAGLVKGEAFAVDASVMEADASRYHGKAPDEIDWSVPERQTRAATSASFLASWVSYRRRVSAISGAAKDSVSLISVRQFGQVRVGSVMDASNQQFYRRPARAFGGVAVVPRSPGRPVGAQESMHQHPCDNAPNFARLGACDAQAEYPLAS